MGGCRKCILQGMETSISLFFKEIKDPRISRHKLYPLEEILLVALSCLICGGEGYDDMQDYGETKLMTMRQVYPYANGIPSSDTFRRVFMLLDHEHFANCFARWMESLHQRMGAEIVAIDGKAALGSQGERKSPVHMVSAWCHERGVVMGQVATDEKSNEIEAIPRLLKLLDIEGSVVTIDAMGCQRDIAKAIVDRKADYVLALKGNQSTLHQYVKDFFDAHRVDGWREARFDHNESSDKGHGRLETRTVTVTDDLDGAIMLQQKKWPLLRTVVEVTSVRTIKGNTSQERRYYISSLAPEAAKIACAVRAHWSIENQLHWTLDVTFGEDDSLIRKGHGPQNLTILRHTAVSLLKAEKNSKRSMPKKSKLAAWTDDYLIKLYSKTPYFGF